MKTHALVRRSPALILACGVLLASAAFAGESKFAGSWKKNLADTESTTEVWPETMKVALSGEELTVDRVVQSPEQGEMSIHFTYRPADEPYEIPAMFGEPRMITTKWSGAKLVVKFDRKGQNDMTVNVVETWKMKGKQLEIKYSARAPVGTFVQKHRYDRVE